MRAFQMCGCLSAAIRAVLITECLLMGVRGDGADSEEEPEIKKHIRDNSTDNSIRRPKEPQPDPLSHLSQSENLMIMRVN
ncbi:uncharacterized protein AKAME5_000988400 [Lates japonicus]|uniref:Secreted protein n=1 Tax=Lates japonicus TaxID=270547 RepID=A0AAD3MP08_LATJO|nr:uncharacterized protein AKAME5_000988400 [Lates japonicus]